MNDKLEQMAREVGDAWIADHPQDEALRGLIQVNALAMADRMLPPDHVVVPVELIEQAHMAGQYDAGVDPSYSNARLWAKKAMLKAGVDDDTD